MAAGGAARSSSRRAPRHVVRAQSEEERAAALKAALEQAQSNPEVRRAVEGSGRCCVFCPRTAPQTLKCPPLPCPTCATAPLLTLRLSLMQVAAKMKQMEEAMANPAMQAQMSQMM